MKFTSKTNFEISSSEVKDFILNLAEGFIKVQQWKADIDEKEAKRAVDSMIKPKVIKRYKTNSKRDMDRFNQQHKRNLKGIRALVSDIDKSTEFIEAKCSNNKKATDIDVSSLPDDIKRQIALDYLKNHPLSEDKQKKIADEYIRKYGVIK